MADDTQLFLASPGPFADALAYQAVAGGRSFFRAQDGRITRLFHQHTLIYTLAGTGMIDLAGRPFPAGPDSLAWLDTARSYAHGAAGPDGWRYLWIGLQGPGLDLLFTRLGLATSPLTPAADRPGLRAGIEAILAGLQHPAPDSDARINLAVAGLVADLVAARQADLPLSPDRGIGRLLRRMRQDPEAGWPIARMAAVAGLGEAQLFRRFRAETGTTPAAWLRRERIERASHLLAATQEKIAAIALRCGYADPFHFSRDFKRLTGTAPRQFRIARRQSG